MSEDGQAAMKLGTRRGEAGITLMELLIVCVIGSIVTGSMIMLWFNINKSSAMTTSHAEARDHARDGIARLSREIRDAEALPPSETAVIEAQPTSIAFTTTFNEAGNELDSTTPRLVRYVVKKPGLYRVLYRDLYADGVIDFTRHDPVREDVVIPYLLNNDASPPFSYTYIDGDAIRKPEPGEDPVHQVPDPGDLTRIQLVGIHVLVDLDPGKAPNAMDLTTQAQLRNQRIIE